MITEGRSDETSGEVSKGTSNEGLMDDDKYKMWAEGSTILTLGGGMSMGESISSGSAGAELTDK